MNWFKDFWYSCPLKDAKPLPPSQNKEQVHQVKQEKECAKKVFEESGHLIDAQVEVISKARITLEMAAEALAILNQKSRKKENE